MGIHAITGKGVNRARARCDRCPREEVVTCDYERVGRGNEWRPNHGQVVRKITDHGWAEVKGNLLCPACEAKRKTEQPKPKETIMVEHKSNVATIRQPTADQEVDIIVMLSSVYDRKQRRYQGAETDATVAEAVGNGCMPGWVAMIREAKFGPAGNEEVEAIRAEIAAVRDEVGQRLDALAKRLDACVTAHDKRVRA